MAPPVHITFLGGLGDIGRNCLALEQEGQILLIDCGLMFPDTDMLGVDLVLPDFTWLVERADDVVGCVVTHGHEDHVGGLNSDVRTSSDSYAEIRPCESRGIVDSIPHHRN